MSLVKASRGWLLHPVMWCRRAGRVERNLLVDIKDFVGEVVSMHFANSRWLMLAFQIFTNVQLRHAKEGLVRTDAPNFVNGWDVIFIAL